jgi:hypothetical protein
MSTQEQALIEIEKRRLEERHLYENFEKYYQKRDFAKASEFLWGSVTKVAYAIGLLFGIKPGKHKEVIALMKELAKGDRAIIDRINSAEALHSNFYHNWMEEGIFEDYVRKVDDLRAWLIKLLDKETEKARAQPMQR